MSTTRAQAPVVAEAAVVPEERMAIERNVLKPEPQRQQLIHCADCKFWKPKSVGFGDCMRSAKYSMGPLLTTDHMSCSEAEPL